MLLEVIAKDIEDVKLINKSYADRIELCGAMEHDGLTPDIDLVKQAAKITKIPMRVMVRNHNDSFYFTEAEINEQISIIEELNQIDNIEGYVIGALNQEQTALDIFAMQRLIKAARGRKITCHKAIESVISPAILDELVSLGVNTVLTQGGVCPIIENYSVLEGLHKYVKTNNYPIEILVGGGVNFTNIEKVKSIARSVHVGKIIRIDHNYDKLISVEQIKRIKEM